MGRRNLTDEQKPRARNCDTPEELLAISALDTSNLERLGTDGMGPWRLGEDRLLKDFVHKRPIEEWSAAHGLLDAYEAAYSGGASVPKPYEVVRVGSGYGVVVEYVRGISLPYHVAFGSYSPTEAGQVMARLLRQMHAVRARAGLDWNARFRRFARKLRTLLPEALGDDLVRFVDSLPEPGTLLHGDPHINNVVVCGGNPIFIDLEYCGFGNPVVDLAIARSRLLLDDFGFRDKARAVWDALLQAYCSEGLPDGMEDPDRYSAILAEVEHCCFRFKMAYTAPEGLSGEQRARLALSAERLELLLGNA